MDAIKRKRIKQMVIDALIGIMLAQANVREAVRVLDGDTVIVQGRKIRLACIDAPEMRQNRGAFAKQGLESLLGGQIPQVQPLGIDFFGRRIAMLTLNNQNINVQMVRQGYAFAYPQYLSNCEQRVKIEIINAEQEAKRAKRGVWADSPTAFPWIFR
jgi:endonuclease YncB( thermonuclease family)